MKWSLNPTQLRMQRLCPWHRTAVLKGTGRQHLAGEARCSVKGVTGELATPVLTSLGC